MMAKLSQKSNYFENHPSIWKIRGNHENLIFDFPEATVNEVTKAINPWKATSRDGIPIKIIKTAQYVIDSDLTNIIKKELNNYKLSENAKAALVRLLYKKNDRGKF